ADKRLTPIGRAVGLVTDERYRVFEERWAKVDEARQRLSGTRVGYSEEMVRLFEALGTQPLRKGAGPTLAELLKRPEMNFEKLIRIDPELDEVDPETREQVEIEVKYEGYIAKQQEQVDRFRRMEQKAIPE